MKRFQTHIIMVSGQATPNVLAVMDKSIRPNEVVLCTTDDMRRNGEILADYFKRHQIRSRIYELSSAYDFAALQEKFLDLAAEFSGRESETGVNLTGGTKLMTIAAQQVFWQDFPGDDKAAAWHAGRRALGLKVFALCAAEKRDVNTV